jgi:hypothetical protein
MHLQKHVLATHESFWNATKYEHQQTAGESCEIFFLIVISEAWSLKCLFLEELKFTLACN